MVPITQKVRPQLQTAAVKCGRVPNLDNSVLANDSAGVHGDTNNLQVRGKR